MRLVYASEVASASGLNCYRPSWETFENVFKRVDWGRPFASACERHTQRLRDAAVDVAPVAPVAAVVRSTVQAREATLESLGVQLLNIRQAASASTTVEELAALEVAVQVQIAVADAVQVAVADAVVQDAAVSPSPSPRAMSSASAAALKHALSAVRCEFGSAVEADSVRRVRAKHGNSKFYKMSLESIQVPQWGVGGRIDGLVNGELVEIKNRRSRLFDNVVVYERVQLETYMRMLDKRTCTLVQHLRVGGEVKERREEVSRNDEFWSEEVLPALELFCAAMDAFVSDEGAQDAFVCADDAAKEAMVNSLLARTTSTMS